MIRGYSCNGYYVKSTALYGEIMGFGQKSDNFTYASVLKVCGDMGLFEIGRSVHCEVFVLGWSSCLCWKFFASNVLEIWGSGNGLGSAIIDLVTRKDTVMEFYDFRLCKTWDAFEGLELFCRMCLEDVSLDQVNIGVCRMVTKLISMLAR
ncbi:hypothetical protein LguiA_022668 [Lonicera macranthoides]